MNYLRLILLVPHGALFSVNVLINPVFLAKAYLISAGNLFDPSSIEKLPLEPSPQKAYEYFRQGSEDEFNSEDQAIEAYSKAIQLDLMSGQSYLERANLYIRKINKTNNKSEQRDLQQKVILDLENAIALLRDHNYYSDPDESWLDSKIADAYFQKGLILWNSGVNSSALEDFRKALELYKKNNESTFRERIIIFINKIEHGEKPPGKHGCDVSTMCNQ